MLEPTSPRPQATRPGLGSPGVAARPAVRPWPHTCMCQARPACGQRLVAGLAGHARPQKRGSPTGEGPQRRDIALARRAHLYVPRPGRGGRRQGGADPAGRGRGAGQNQALARLAAPESRRDPGQG